MTASIPSHFVLIARRYGMEDTELNTLEHYKVTCANDLFFKYPNEDTRETFLQEVLLPVEGFRDPETNEITCHPRQFEGADEAS